MRDTLLTDLFVVKTQIQITHERYLLRKKQLESEIPFHLKEQLESLVRDPLVDEYTKKRLRQILTKP